MCPENCQCHGYAFVCTGKFPAENYPELKYLNADGTGMKLQDVSSNTLLIHLSLQHCGITHLDSLQLPNLNRLDLSHNSLASFTGLELATSSNLRQLSMASNRFLSLNLNHSSSISFPSIELVDFSDLNINELSDSFLDLFPNVQYLNLSGSRIEKISDKGFSELRQLKVLDLTGCPVTYFSSDIFKGLENLETIIVDNYKLCCPAVLPETFLSHHCHAPEDEISSCDALLKADVYRVFLALNAFLALVGNFVSFGFRVFSQRGAKKQLGFDVFVTHLCVSDFLMGVYLTIIGVADRIHYGTYVWYERAWTHSIACHLAGFISFVSNEVSAFLICFITLERFISVRFPLKGFRFTLKSAQVLSVAGWVVGVVLAAVPLLPFTEHWQFYSQTGICIPLPITRKRFPGSDYSFYVMIVFNFVLFLLVAVGQLLIFWSYHSHSKTVSRCHKKSKDMVIARRLLVVAMSDFLCWFPIGLLGLLARSGVRIPGEANIIIAIFILPINSAVNPFLYTLLSVRGSYRQASLKSRERPSKERESGKIQDTQRAEPVFTVSQAGTRRPPLGHVNKPLNTSTGTLEANIADEDYTPEKAHQLMVKFLRDGLVTTDQVKLQMMELDKNDIQSASAVVHALRN